jgi:hypothetical protein
MFNVQKCPGNREIYIYYNEYIEEEEDESVEALEHMLVEDEIKGFRGIIDLITVKYLSNTDFARIQKMHDLLKGGMINKLDVISDNVNILESIKGIMPDVSTRLLKVE